MSNIKRGIYTEEEMIQAVSNGYGHIWCVKGSSTICYFKNTNDTQFTHGTIIEDLKLFSKLREIIKIKNKHSYV